MKWVIAGIAAMLLLFGALPLGIVTAITIVAAPAVSEQIPLDPCGTYTATTPVPAPATTPGDRSPTPALSAEDCLPADGELPDFDGACPPSGSAAERGLQATARHGLRCVKAAFPAIKHMGGRGGRPISTSDHPRGLAVDFMIPRWNTRAGNDFGWQVARWVKSHAKALRVKYVLWDARKWNPQVSDSWRPYRHPLGNRNPTLAHRDHVHVSFYSR
ncbi:MAG: hypothetical protein LCH76_12970 [Actinobacteria bacterium]|nr:hypothetical protein [Actinomycetota bacterium]